MKKRIWAWMLTICLVLTMMPMSVFATDTESTDENVAEVDETTSSLKVATYDELVEALAGEAKEIVITQSIDIPGTENVILDLNGKTITGDVDSSRTDGGHIYAINNYGNLTINDTVGSGKISSRGIYNYGNLTLNGGIIDACDGNGGYAVSNESGSTFIMNGGTLTASYEDDNSGSNGGYDATPIKVPDGATVTLNGGEITNVCDFTFAIGMSGGTLNVPESSTVVVSGAHGAISMSGGTANIYGGVFKCIGVKGQTDNVVYISGGTMNIYGGTFTHSGQEVEADSGSAVVVSGDSAIVNISNGSFTGLNGAISGNSNTVVTGGTFYNGAYDTNHYDDVSGFVPDGYKYDSETGTVTEDTTSYVASITKNGETTNYETLTAAVEAAENGDEIVLLSDVTENVKIAKQLTLNLNGKTITGNSSSATVYVAYGGDVTITGNGFVTNDGYDALGNYGTLTVENGTFTGNYALYNYCYAEFQNASVAVINGGTFKAATEGGVSIANCGDMAINNATIEDVLDSSAKLTITGENTTIESLIVKAPDNYTPQSGTSNVITGGTISKINVSALSDNTLEISGGTFAATDVENIQSYVKEGYVINADGTVIEDTSEETELPAFYGANMTLENALEMSFFIEKSKLPDTTGMYAVITQDRWSTFEDGNIELQVEDWEEYGDYYRLRYKGIAAKEMTDTITIVIKNSEGEAVTQVWTDSVAAYGLRGIDRSSDPNEVELFKALLNYGAAAQTFKGYNTEKLANSGVQ